MRIALFRRAASIYKRQARQSLILGTFICAVASASATTTVIFNPGSVSGGPFPTNALAISDNSSGTGLRINLDSTTNPLSKGDEDNCDPAGHASVCSNAALLNTLDGFSVNPRVMACFSGPINPATVMNGMRIVSADPPAVTIPLNQVIYDSKSHCVYGKPNTILNQRSRYVLLVTNGILDSTGRVVADDGSFQTCLHSNDPYCSTLAKAVAGISQSGMNNQIVSASLFTTMSATSWLENAHQAVNSYPAAAIPAGSPSVFNVADLQTVTWQPDHAASLTGTQTLPLSVLAGVGQIAFGLFSSPNYLNISGAAPGTITGNSPVPIPIPTPPGLTPGLVPVSFHVFLPAGTPPPGGWPVVIYGHGLSDNQFGAPTYIASTMASWGFATLAMEITGHGFGPNGTVVVTDKNNRSTLEATPGRGIQFLPGTPIGSEDGCIIPGAIAIRDCGRQTAVDLFALVKTIRQTSGLGLGLNADRLFYVGQSFGSIYGALFHAVEPNVKAAVINSGGGTFTDVARLAITARPLGGIFLARLGLLNVPPAPSQAYFPCTNPLFQPCFNDEYPYRDQPPVTSSVPGSIEIQAAFEATEWLGMLGDPLAFAPHFKTAPLAGVPPKATLFQFGLGDLEVPNPTESALIRAADAQETSWYFRFDLAVGVHRELLSVAGPGLPLPILPHRILSNTTIFGVPSEKPISLAEQHQVAAFFLLNGWDLVDPNWFLPFEYFGKGIFQRPVVLPEALQFLQFPPN